jgi:hypothetical protein
MIFPYNNFICPICYNKKDWSYCNANNDKCSWFTNDYFFFDYSASFSTKDIFPIPPNISNPIELKDYSIITLNKLLTFM